MDTFKQCPATKPAKSFYEGGKQSLLSWVTHLMLLTDLLWNNQKLFFFFNLVGFLTLCISKLGAQAKLTAKDDMYSFTVPRYNSWHNPLPDSLFQDGLIKSALFTLFTFSTVISLLNFWHAGNWKFKSIIGFAASIKNIRPFSPFHITGNSFHYFNKEIK